MIKINKSSAPTSLIEYKRTVNASFDNLPSDVKQEIRNSLLKEQGYICAYCMKRINNENDTKIEHYIPRNSENDLDYLNLLAVCYGNEGFSKEIQTCDTRKANLEIKIDPQDEVAMNTISYTSLGIIKSRNLRYENDINNILNLNCPIGYLKSNRKAALDGLKEVLHKKKVSLKKEHFKRIYENYIKEKELNGRHTEYVGILLWYLKRKI